MEQHNKCTQCNKIITKAKNKFCNRECYLLSHKMKFSTIECAKCGKEFKKQTTSIKYDNNYCSSKCRTKKERVLTCIVCDVKFCAFQYRKANNKKGFTIIRPFKKVCSKKCHYEFYRTDQNRKDKISKAFLGEKHPMWAGGISQHNSRGSSWATIREEVFKIKGHCCEKCKINRTDHKNKYGMDIHIDHIIPYHSFDTEKEANEITNLRPLCISCHGKEGKKTGHGKYKKKKDELLLAKFKATGVNGFKELQGIKNDYEKVGNHKSNIREVMKKYNVSKDTIRKISNGIHWSNKYLT